MTTVGNHSEYLDNIGEAANPGAVNDATQGYSVGSKWFNTSTKVWWRCVDATANAAVWSQGQVAGANASGTVAGGTSSVTGGTAVSATGGSAYVAGGASSAGNGGRVSIFGGAGTVNGGIILGAGTIAGGSGINGGLPTTDPHVAGMLYAPSVAGAVSISGG